MIVDGALQAISEYGFAKATLQNIAERVGLTRQGVLHHFNSKDVLFLEVIEQERRWAGARIAQGAAAGLAALRAMVTFLGESGESRMHLRFVHVIQGEAIHLDAPAYEATYAADRLAHIREEVAAHLTQAQAHGEVDPDIDIDAAATLITGAINGLQSQWLIDDTVDSRAAFDLLLDLVTRTNRSL